VPGGRLDPARLRALAACAALGNGIVDLTSRAAVQVRGLPPDGGGCAEVLAQAGLLPSVTHERVRNIIATPFAGRHPASVADTDPIVAALDRAVCADPRLAALPGRFLFAVDDGSGTVGPHRADVTLTAVDARQFVVRFSDGLVRDGIRPAVGRLRQRDGRLAMTALPPLGRLDHEQVGALADLSLEFRLSTSRTLTVLDLADERDAADVTERFSEMGLVTDRDSGWVGLSACAGLGACSRARFDVRRAAAQRARVRWPGSPIEHWAACDRGCGRPVGA
jgi:precorrin-3B synthase